MKKVITLSVLALLALSLPAQACNRVAVKAVAVQPVVAVNPIAVATFVPVAVPQYSVGYGASNHADELEALREEVKALRSALKEALTPPVGEKAPKGDAK